MKAERYEGIVKKHQPEMEHLYPQGVKFQHDNAKAHIAAEENLEKTTFKIIKYPRYSPDLSPIENLWGTLKQRVKCDAPRSEAELIKSLQRNWKILTQPNNREPYYVNLHDRFNECIEKRGINLPY